MKQLTDETILRIMNEEWDKKVKKLQEEVDTFFQNEQQADPVVSAGLKVMHKKSKIRYTVDSIAKKDVVLLSPEGNKFLISADELESEYELS
jgi:ribosome biogenesis protein Tsr3